MALTQSDWTEKDVNGVYVASCTVVSTTAENDAYTKRTPKGLDPSKPWMMLYKASGTPDGQALPMDLWVGFNDNFALSGDGANVVATNGAEYKSIFDDVVLAVNKYYAFAFDPNLGVADVVTVAAIATGPKVKVPVAPYYAFNLDGGSTLAAVTHTFVIIQAGNEGHITE